MTDDRDDRIDHGPEHKPEHDPAPEADDALDDKWMASARRLGGDVQPERDLWPAIEAAIASRTSPDVFLPLWKRYLAQAAAVVLLVGASSGLTYLAVNGDSTDVSPVARGGVVPLDAMSASFGEQYTLGPDFQDARRDLEGRLDRELERLPPGSRSEVEKNMQTIRTAINEISAALSDEPDNELLQELLLSSYREELALMRKVNGITGTVMLREDI